MTSPKKVLIFYLLTAYMMYVQPRRSRNFLLTAFLDSTTLPIQLQHFVCLQEKNSLYVACCMKHIPGVNTA
jgi:hypothetical protein